jgi:hypothetical protein
MPKQSAGIVELVLDADPRAKALPAGADMELAQQKLLFLTPPAEFVATLSAVSKSLDDAFGGAELAQRERMVSFLLGAAESLGSPVELSHNLRNAGIHGKGKTLSSVDAAKARKIAVDVLGAWAQNDKNAFAAAVAKIKDADSAANGGDNLFAAWAKRWAKRNGRDPYATVDDYLACFTPLYQRGMYYPDLYFAREAGKTRTQFLADSSEQAARLRRVGCLGCYTKTRMSGGKAEPVEQTTIPFRSIYLIRGLGIPGTSGVIKQFDEILLDGAAALYRSAAAVRADDSDIRAWFYHLGRTSDEIRQYRLNTLIGTLKDGSKFRQIDRASVTSFRHEPVNCIEFILQLQEQGIEFKPGDEEDAIDHAGALLVKRAAVLKKDIQLVVADKANYLPNQELLDIHYACDSPQVQRDCMMRPVEVDDWKSLWEDMDKNGNPIPGTVWAKRAEILTAIWPEWGRTFESAGA